MRCQGCSKGCKAKISERESGTHVEGCLCTKGVSGILETLNNGLSTYKYYLPVRSGYMKHILIVSDQPVDQKEFEHLDELVSDMVLTAPIVKDQVIIANPLGLNTNLIAARSLQRRK